jgi:hypothetical protein
MVITLEDYLVGLHTGQWFGFNNLNGSDANKTYANLVIHSSDAKPTEQECTDGVSAMQINWDTQGYARKRKAEYDQLNQFEMQFDDNRDDTTTWPDAINEIKMRYPK